MRRRADGSHSVVVVVGECSDHATKSLNFTRKRAFLLLNLLPLHGLSIGMSGNHFHDALVSLRKIFLDCCQLFGHEHIQWNIVITLT